MKMILGLWALANSNRFLTNFSDSPNHFDTKSDDDTEKKVELLASVATALAKYDLPVPGGCESDKLTIRKEKFLDCAVPQTVEFLSRALFCHWINGGIL